LPNNTPLAVKVEPERNPGNHRRFFAFIRTAFRMQEHYQSEEHLRKALLIKAGYYDAIESHKDGKVTFIPKSMNFDRMKEPEFKKVFNDCLGAFHTMLTEMDRHISENEIYQLLDFE